MAVSAVSARTCSSNTRGVSERSPATTASTSLRYLYYGSPSPSALTNTCSVVRLASCTAAVRASTHSMHSR